MERFCSAGLFYGKGCVLVTNGRRICLIGFSEINRRWALKQPRPVEIWGINEAHFCTIGRIITTEDGKTKKQMCACFDPNRCECNGHSHDFVSRYDRWFQLHPRNWKHNLRIAEAAKLGGKIDPRDLNCFGRNARHVRFLKETDKAIYTLRRFKSIPQSIAYPFGEITRTFGIPRGVNGRKWLYATSTPAYMLALALYEHMQGNPVAEVRLAGIELAVGSEYFWQRPCLEYYLGIARGLDIKVKVAPMGSSLLAAPRYILDPPIMPSNVNGNGPNKELPEEMKNFSVVEGAYKLVVRPDGDLSRVPQVALSE